MIFYSVHKHKTVCMFFRWLLKANACLLKFSTRDAALIAKSKWVRHISDFIHKMNLFPKEVWNGTKTLKMDACPIVLSTN